MDSLRKIKYFLYFLPFLAFFWFFCSASSASNLYRVYDKIDYPYPSTSTNHVLYFTFGQTVPQSGRIVVSFQDDGISIPGGFDYQDLDLALAASGSDNFIEQPLSAVASSTSNGVSVVTGLGGQITITLNSASGFATGTQARLEMGTNATYGAAGDTRLVNAANTGAYWIDVKTYNAALNLLDRVKTFIVMIQAVHLNIAIGKMRGNGLPDGVLEASTTMTIMSLTTNYDADCRWSASSGKDYYEMTESFYSSEHIYHTDILTGLESAKCYAYYVRCYDRVTHEVNFDDYVIDFCVAPRGTGTGGGTGGGTGTGTGGGSGTGSGGAGGGGGGGGSGLGTGLGTGVFKPYPPDTNKPPAVSFSGWSYPSARVTLLQDNLKIDEVSAGGDSAFYFGIPTLKRGLYTFGMWALDSESLKSPVYSSTFWVEENTQTIISNIILPPTTRVASNAVPVGQDIKASGQAAPAEKVEVNLYFPQTKQTVGVREIVSLIDGKWQLSFPTKDLAKGIYELKARVFKTKVGWSAYGETIKCGVGEKPEEGPCSRSDINKDGKVNLVDFSILMYYWGTKDASADLNQDGKIDLVDFSIMMYCWTG